MKKLFTCAFLVLFVLSVFFVSCNRASSPAAATSTAGIWDGPVERPELIRVLGNVVNWNEDQGSDQWEEAFFRLTGSRVEFIRGVGNYTERVNLIWASGDIPDIFEPGGSAMMMQFASNGALHDVTDMFYNSPMVEGALVEVADAIKYNGRLYTVPSTFGNGSLTYVRQDWLDQLGITQYPRTWDEFYQLMVTFRDRNPAGIAAGTIPYVSAGVMSSAYMHNFYPGVNTQPNFYVNEHGVVVEGMYEPNTLIGLQRLALSYRERLIDQESITNTTTAARDKFYSGIVGMFTYWAGTWSENIQNNTVMNVPTALIEPMPPIQGSYPIDRPPSWTMSIPSQNRNPRGMFRYFIETAFDRGPGMMLFHHGVEGVHWARDGGTYRKLPDFLFPDRLQSSYIFNPMLTIYPWDDPFPNSERVQKSLDIFNQYAHRDVAIATDPSITHIISELSTAREELVARIIMGTITAEAGIQQYRTQYDRQVQQALEVMNR